MLGIAVKRSPRWPRRLRAVAGCDRQPRSARARAPSCWSRPTTRPAPSIQRRCCRRSSRSAAQRGIWLIVDETYRDFLADGSGCAAWSVRQSALAGQFHRALQLLQILLHSRPSPRRDHRRRRVVEQIVKIMDNLQICAPRPAQHAVAKAIPALAAWRDANRAEMAPAGRRVSRRARQFALAYRGARRLFRLRPPSLCRRKRRCRRRAAGPRSRHRHRARPLFRKRAGAVPAAGFRQCRRSDDCPSGDPAALRLRPEAH